MSLIHNVSDRARSAEDSLETDSAEASKPGKAEPPVPPENGGAGTGGSLTRVTANFTPRAIGALDRVAAQTGDTKTDILNRSVMVYEVFLELIEKSGGTLVVELPEGKERLRLL